MALNGLEVLVGERVAGFVPALRTQIEVGGGVVDAAIGQDSVEHLQAFGNDFLADAVTGNYCDVQCHTSIFPRPRAPGRAHSNPWSVYAVTCPIDEAEAGSALTPQASATSRMGQTHAPEEAK